MKSIKITQTGSFWGQTKKLQANILGLGLGKIGRTRVLLDTPEVRGMLVRVKHLVKMEEGLK